MAFFLKVSKHQSRTYLSIYESFYSPDVKGTRHRSYRSLGNIQKLIDLRGYYRVTGRHPGYKQYNPDDELLHKKD